AHAALDDDMVAGVGLEPRNGLRAPAALDQGIRLHRTFEQRRVQGHAARIVLDDEPDMDDGHADTPALVGEATGILDRVLLAAMLRCTGGGKRAAIYHHVVLHVLDDQRATAWVEAEFAIAL